MPNQQNFWPPVEVFREELNQKIFSSGKDRRIQVLCSEYCWPSKFHVSTLLDVVMVSAYSKYAHFARQQRGPLHFHEF